MKKARLVITGLAICAVVGSALAFHSKVSDQDFCVAKVDGPTSPCPPFCPDPLIDATQGGDEFFCYIPVDDATIDCQPETPCESGPLNLEIEG